MTALLALLFSAFKMLKHWFSSSACTAQSASEQGITLLPHPSSKPN